MLDPANDLLPPANSPSISSVSSSDLDTESTGSFFHDRSTTLGTLMGVSFAAIPSQQQQHQHQSRNIHVTATAASISETIPTKRKNKKKRAHQPTVSTAAAASVRRRWWRLCGEDDAKPASLGEFLEVERKFGDTTFYDAEAELESVAVSQHRQPRNGRVLFADGRVLPPAADSDETSSSTAEVLCRFPVSITGICR